MDNLSSILRAIAHPVRRAIVTRLFRGPARVTEIAEPFDMSLNAVSKHLKILEQAGLVHLEKQGRNHVFEFDDECLRQVAAWIGEYVRV